MSAMAPVGRFTSGIRWTDFVSTHCRRWTLTRSGTISRMADSPELSAPLHFQRVGWQGLALLVPEGWNLRLFDGNQRAGALFFADLHATRLELRWRSRTLLARCCGGNMQT